MPIESFERMTTKQRFIEEYKHEIAESCPLESHTQSWQRNNAVKGNEETIGETYTYMAVLK